MTMKLTANVLDTLLYDYHHLLRQRLMLCNIQLISLEIYMDPFMHQHPQKMYGKLHEEVNHAECTRNIALYNHTSIPSSEGRHKLMPWCTKICLGCHATIHGREKYRQHMTTIQSAHAKISIFQQRESKHRGPFGHFYWLACVIHPTS